MNNITSPYSSIDNFVQTAAQQPTYVVGMGEALWDVLPEGKQIGGAPANFAFHVSQFGLESRVVSALGADKLGLEIREVLAQRQLQGLIEEVPYPTGTVQVSIDAEGVHSLHPCPTQFGPTYPCCMLGITGSAKHCVAPNHCTVS